VEPLGAFGLGALVVLVAWVLSSLRRPPRTLPSADPAAERAAQLEAANRRLATVLDGMGEGVLATDRQQKVLFVNAAAARLLEFPLEGAVGRPLWELVRLEPILKGSLEAIEAGASRTVQVGPLRERHLSVSFSPGPGLVVLVISDVTESARYQELRKEFVANVSHELRTPLTMIRGYLETLEDGAIRDPEKGPEFLGIITKHARLLSNLVDNLLDLSRLEGQGLGKRVRVDLAALVERVMDLRRPSAEKKGQSLDAVVAPDVPDVLGDADYLERAVSNLVDNAVKYTPEGGSIRITASRRGVQVAVQVSDDGIGIPESDLPRIFERFYRVDKSRSRDMGGTGLGLAIVKHVIQSHGGTIEVESALGKGSTFRVLLPPAPDER
jgi:two-component system phosphate regulon sensor histidine kinase PhoR